MTTGHDNVEGLYHMANRGIEELLASQPEKKQKEQKTWHRLVDNWAKTLPKNERKAVKTTLYAFFQWWGAQPEKQRYRPYEFKWPDWTDNLSEAVANLHD